MMVFSGELYQDGMGLSHELCVAPHEFPHGANRSPSA